MKRMALGCREFLRSHLQKRSRWLKQICQVSSSHSPAFDVWMDLLTAMFKVEPPQSTPSHLSSAEASLRAILAPLASSLASIGDTFSFSGSRVTQRPASPPARPDEDEDETSKSYAYSNSRSMNGGGTDRGEPRSAFTALPQKYND